MKSKPDFSSVLDAARLLQRHFPECVLVGGTGSALHARHRESHDLDFTSREIAEHFDEYSRRLEQLAGWETTRLRKAKIIMGTFQEVETCIRQLQRKEPLETTVIDGIVVPTLPEMTRIKGMLLVKRNTLRDYWDFVELTKLLIAQAGKEKWLRELRRLDEFYETTSGSATVREELTRRCAEPIPSDITDEAERNRVLSGIPWEEMVAMLRDLSLELGRDLLHES